MDRNSEAGKSKDAVENLAAEMVREASQKVMMPEKRKRYVRYGFWLVFLFLVWFCLIPSCPRITEETHLFTEPRTATGKGVDYYALFIQKQEKRLLRPEENGFRLVLAAMGPRVLEQAALAERVRWESMPVDENSRDWWERCWLPLCQKLQIDPNHEPEFLGYQSLVTYLEIHGLTGNEQPFGEKRLWDHYEQVCSRIPSDVAMKCSDSLMNQVWSAEEYPTAAAWLEDVSPLLDLTGRAVRMPEYTSFHSSAGNLLLEVLLPDTQAQRELVRDLKIRALFRMGAGDFSGAMYDTISQIRLGRHLFRNALCFVESLCGIACITEGEDCLRQVLSEGRATEAEWRLLLNELLEAGDYSDLSDYSVSETLFLEQRLELDYVQYILQHRWTCLHSKEFEELTDLTQAEDFSTPLWLSVSILPLDHNVVMKRFTSHVREFFDGFPVTEPRALIAKCEENEAKAAQLRVPLPGGWLGLLSIRNRSQCVGDRLYSLISPSCFAAAVCRVRIIAQSRIGILAVALEEYRQKQGSFPDRLDFLQGKEWIPLRTDPFTDHDGLRYEREGDGYRLWSVGPNGRDDQGRRESNGPEPADDLLFQR